jgi:hypothetical protein
VVQINSSLLTVTIYSSVITTLVYNDTKYPVPSISDEVKNQASGGAGPLIQWTYNSTYPESLYSISNDI